jgi:uncharacterized GH25 family protein
MRTLQVLTAFVAILSATLLASAHEFWVRPGDFTAVQGGLGRFYLMHGHRFEGEFVPRNEPYVERFELVDADGTQRIMGQHGQPTNVARFGEPGTSVVVYQSREVLSELGPERFAAYLEEQGLDDMARQRETQGETGTPGREVYVRCAKALVRVSAGGETAPAGLADRVAGLPLEIVLEPLDAAMAGQAARVRVLLDGQPLAGARVVAVSQAATNADPDAATILRTDEDGMASFDVDQAGPWMVTCLHMFRTEGRDDADWKSFWASLTFDIDGGTTPEAG